MAESIAERKIVVYLICLRTLKYRVIKSNRMSHSYCLSLGNNKVKNKAFSPFPQPITYQKTKLQVNHCKVNHVFRVFAFFLEIFTDYPFTIKQIALSRDDLIVEKQLPHSI